MAAYAQLSEYPRVLARILALPTLQPTPPQQFVYTTASLLHANDLQMSSNPRHRCNRLHR